MSLSPTLKIALYGFSADPITYGHLDIIKRSLRIFDRLHVVIFNNNLKKYSFNFEKRIALVKQVLAHEKRVQVNGFTGLLVDYAYQHNIKYLVRGIRNITDLNYESDISFANLSQLRNIETVYLFARPELTNISSSMVKQLQYDMGNVTRYVPLAVKSEMEKNYEKQFRLVITGSIGAGKTTIVRELFKQLPLPVDRRHEIDLDQITDKIYADQRASYKKDLFQKLAAAFGKEVVRKNGTVDKRSLSKVIFADKSGTRLKELDRLMKEPLWYETRSRLRDLKGLVFISGAIIPEKNWLSIANNNVLFIDISTKVQLDRLVKRDKISRNKAALKIKYSSSSAKKLSKIKKIQQNDHYGQTLIFKNDKPLTQAKIRKLGQSILKMFPGLKDCHTDEI